MIEQDGITKILPQRFPFLFIDRVLEFEKGKRLVALKNVTINEEFFHGHFPLSPVMPGVLLIEAMGQAGIIFLNLNVHDNPSEIKDAEIYYLYSVKARFLHPVKPGDQVIIEVTPVKMTKDSGIIKTVAKVNGKEAARAELIGTRHGKSA